MTLWSCTAVFLFLVSVRRCLINLYAKYKRKIKNAIRFTNWRTFPTVHGIKKDKNQNNKSETIGIDFTNEIISCADIDFF